MTAFALPLSPANTSSVIPLALHTVFWEADTACAAAIAEQHDVVLEKEAWIARMLSTRGCCGFNLVSADRDGDSDQAIGTVLYCPAELAPGAALMPTAPVSDDAELVTSLFCAYPDSSEGQRQALLLLAAVADELTQRGVVAMEMFAFRNLSGTRRRGQLCTDDTATHSAPETMSQPLRKEVADALLHPGKIGLLDFQILLEAGFHIAQDHPIVPRMRLELPPTQGLLYEAASTTLLADNEFPIS
ncbi:hypothetical protein ACFPVT_03145 [Corynebacterium choanae]|uniref:GNAT family N-acetyltransferase n=1 Tax=Corynebacterium choanae TaxID=1862358 RepID=A0A3G6JAA9_9CORY|nr:hypothetical protein [Corynebacterium choanae]AZA14733.1 hypothetical protein CCHOA_11810 [Corynebacterium choanae]